MADDDLMAQVAALSGHPELWPQADVRVLTTLAFASFLRYGVSTEQGWIPSGRSLYACVVQRASVEERGRLLNRIGEALDGKPGAANVFFTIAVEETEHRLIASAALDFALYVTPEDGDPLTGPRTLRELATRPECPDHTRAGLLSGLLWLGDRRTAPLLERCWELLTAQGQSRLAFAHSGYMYPSTVSFLLDWLDACAAANDWKTFTIVSAGLQLAGGTGGRVVDVERRFPVWQEDGTPPLRVLHEWSVPAYGRLIEARLHTLRAQEPLPGILHLAQRAWGISPF